PMLALWRKTQSIQARSELELIFEVSFSFFFLVFPGSLDPVTTRLKRGRKFREKNFLPLSPVQISLVTPSFDKISELGKREILPANHPAFARSGAASANRRKLKANRISAHSRLPRRSLGE